MDEMLNDTLSTVQVEGFTDYELAKTFCTVAQSNIAQGLRLQSTDPEGLLCSVENLQPPSNGKPSYYMVDFTHPSKDLARLLKHEIDSWMTQQSLTPNETTLKLVEIAELGHGTLQNGF